MDPTASAMSALRSGLLGAADFDQIHGLLTRWRETLSMYSAASLNERAFDIADSASSPRSDQATRAVPREVIAQADLFLDHLCALARASAVDTAWEWGALTLQHAGASLAAWLAQPTYRAGRAYLTQARGLALAPAATIMLQRLIAHAATPRSERQALQDRQAILALTRAGGTTEEAVSEAYVGVLGGFTLDAPAWLIPLETEAERLYRSGGRLTDPHTDPLVRDQAIALWRRALAQACAAVETPAPLVAEIHLALFDALRGVTDVTRMEALKEGVGHLEAALAIYTRSRYPRMWALVQHNLGAAYRVRLDGDRAENIERAIAACDAALQVRQSGEDEDALALTLNTLGNAYRDRLRGNREENLARATACFRSALHALDQRDTPAEWSAAQNNLGVVSSLRRRGGRRAHMVDAIRAYRQALQVRTRAILPYEWATTQNNLGTAYALLHQYRAGAAMQQAIAAYRQALMVFTEDAYPIEWAMTRNNLGAAYAQWLDGPRLLCRRLALRHYRAALRGRMAPTLPLERRQTLLNLAEIQAERGQWAAAAIAYQEARDLEEAALALAPGPHERDALLRSGRDAAVRLGFALAQLGRTPQAILAVERGRARALWEARLLDSESPERILDRGRRHLFITARDELRAAQAAAHEAPLGLSESQARMQALAHAEATRRAQARFHAALSAIRAAGDPPHFLEDTTRWSALRAALEQLPAGQAIVYLLATPWGGLALGLRLDSAQTTGDEDARKRSGLRWNAQAGVEYATLALPHLTDALLQDTLEVELQDGSGRLVGGFGVAQTGRAWDLLLSDWPGVSLQDCAAALASRCAAVGQESALCDATQDLLRSTRGRAIARTPLTLLPPAERGRLRVTLNHLLLQRELRRGVTLLAAAAIRPLAAWLRAHGVMGLSLIPCGALAALPVLAAPIDDHVAEIALAKASAFRTLADALPSAILPSARSILPQNMLSQPAPDGGRQATPETVFTLGDPRPTRQPLHWAEAEALTIAEMLGASGQARVGETATRDWLLHAFSHGSVVALACHATYNHDDFLQSRLQLAQRTVFTLGEAFAGSVPMRHIRLLMLSACETAMLALQGASDEMRSLAIGLLGAGAPAVLGALWPVDDRATYLLMVRFIEEWAPHMREEPPAAALARAQAWLRNASSAQLRLWRPGRLASRLVRPRWRRSALLSVQLVRGAGARYSAAEAGERIRARARLEARDNRPYADPIYWAAFQVHGW